MKLIAHRANLNGKNPERENSPEYIQEALVAGYDIEIDVWFINNQFYLGHDNPQYLIDSSFLKNDRFWCHAKNLAALNEMLKLQVHCFFHQTDTGVLTSKGYIWTYPGNVLFANSVCVLPESDEAYNTYHDLFNCFAICTDEVEIYKQKLKQLDEIFNKRNH